MSIDSTVVEQIVTQAQEEYEQKTVLINDLIRTADSRISGQECTTDISTGVESLDRILHPITISNVVDDIRRCERQKFFSSLQKQATDNEQFTQDLVGNLLNVVNTTSRAAHLFLPDKPNYMAELDHHQFKNTIRATRSAEIHWYQSDVFQSEYGFLLSDGVYIEQEPQNQIPITAGNLDVTPSGNYSDNRLRVHLKRISGGQIEVDFRTEFTQPQLIENQASIIELDLPNPGQI